MCVCSHAPVGGGYTLQASLVPSSGCMRDEKRTHPCAVPMPRSPWLVCLPLSIFLGPLMIVCLIMSMVFNDSQPGGAGRTVTSNLSRTRSPRFFFNMRENKLLLRASNYFKVGY